MQPHSQRHYTLKDYFGIEESSQIRHEFYDGEIFAMAGGSRNHNRITLNLVVALDATLRKTECALFSIDMRVRTTGGLYTYPDLLVVCGNVELSDDPLETITNPVVVMEVLSPSTRDYDRGEKFTQYSTIRTLKDYVLIEQSLVGIEHWWLTPAGEWELQRHGSPDSRLQVSSIGFTVSLSEIYDQVDFGG